MPAPRPAPEMMMLPLRRLLRPLVRLMVRCGVLCPAAIDMLRALYVEVAEEELGPAQRTDSRVSLLTGVHRKEIKRQREIPPDEPPPPLVTRNAQLIATWLGAAGFTSEAGEPLPLPRSAPEGPSFESLVTAVTRDVRPRAVLDDWLSQGIVTIGVDDRIRLSTEAFLPQPGRDEQLFYFARNIHDHIAAASANVLAQQTPPFIDRSVHYDHLTPETAAALEQAGRAAVQRVLLDFNRRALTLAAEEAPAGTPTRRINLGVYLFLEDEPLQ
jgi:hypothetical protein